MYPVPDTARGQGCAVGIVSRHSFFPFVEGFSEPAYTDQELAEMNEPKYDYNGKKLTEEQADDRQRYIERQIRRWKREKAAMAAAGQDPAESAARVRHWQEVQRDFLSQTGLKRQYERERI